MKHHELFQRLFVPFDAKHKVTKRVSGTNLTFVEWYMYVQRGHKEFPQGYSKEVRYIQEIGQIFTDEDGTEQVDDRQLVVCVRITDNETGAYQEALGTAPVRKDKAMFGGAMAEAESQAFRRAMANWGLGLEMYMDPDEVKEAQKPVKQKKVAKITERQKEVLRVLAPLLDKNGKEEQVKEWRGNLKAGASAGAVIREMRNTLTDLGLEDPTKADEE